MAKFTNEQLYLRSRLRPRNYTTLTAQEQWSVDKRLGLLDWDGTYDPDKMDHHHKAKTKINRRV